MGIGADDRPDERGAQRRDPSGGQRERPPVTVVGIGADGWSGLAPRARDAITGAEVLLGSERQLALVPAGGPGRRVPWPSPLLPALPKLLAEHGDRRLCVLASGDPMFHGIGATLARLAGAHRLHVIPHPSTVSLACARLGWPGQDVEVVSAVGRPLAALHRALAPGRRVLLLSADATTPAEAARLLSDAGYGATHMAVLEELGGPGETRRDGRATDWDHPPGNPLNVVALDCRLDAGARALSTLAGLPDDAFEHDGQLTKREIRAVTLARLAPLPGELLWDIGAGAGSVAIEWLRAHPSCRAIAVERDPRRARRVARNAERLGVPELAVIEGEAPAALAGLERPDAVFVGGGVGDAALLAACWDVLAPGGRMVANAVTLSAEARVLAAAERYGGDLTRLQVQRTAPLGGFTAFKPALPVTQWTVVKTEDAGSMEVAEATDDTAGARRAADAEYAEGAGNVGDAKDTAEAGHAKDAAEAGNTP